jgi:diguanylate cyclase (GGDEF)-like protein/PAS domain S-box-containing protein
MENDLTRLRRFRAAMDMSGDAVYLVDRATMRFVDVNLTACTRTGYSHEELLAMGPQDLLKTSREDIERSYDEVIAAGEQGITTESAAQYKDGQRSQAELHRRALRTDGGWIIVSIARDITQRAHAERVSRRLSRMYAALNATNEAILHASSSGELYQLVCNAGVYGGKSLSTSALVPGPDGSSMEIVAIAGIGEEQLRGAFITVDESVAEGRGLVGMAFRMLQPCVSNDYLNDERTRFWHETAGAAGVRAGAAVPLVRAGRAVGVLLFYSDKKGAFDEDVVKLLQRMAENVAFALDNFARETERKRAEEALRDSEERFRSLTELSSDWYWEQDADFRFSRFEGQRVAGMEDALKRIYGKRPWEHGYDVEGGGGWEAHRALLQAHQPFRDLILAHGSPDKARRYTSVSGEPMFDAGGRFTGYRGIGRDVTERRHAERRVEYLATHDEMTGLPNRAMFDQVLRLAVDLARRHERRLAVLFIDLDHFKAVNDTLGHAAGDALLKRIAACLKHCLRSSDVVARRGGDEFVVMIQDVTDTREIAVVARKILSGVIDSASAGGEASGVTASLGIAMYPGDAQDEAALMKYADVAMYRAKERGKNNFQFVSGYMDEPGEPPRLRAGIAANPG